jgi:NitT/TauT family transport system substrate-binding protein
MNMTKRLSLWILALAALALSFGCSSKEQGSGAAGGAAGRTKVKLVLNWVPEPEFGGFYAGREGGSFEKQGLDLEILGGGAGVPVVQMVANGQAELGIAGADEVLTAKARGADIVAVFAVYQTSPQGIMARPERAKTLADVFASGTLALEPGVPYSLFLKKKFGFDRVKIVPYDGGVARFVADKDFAQQCFVTSEPLAAKRKGIEPKVFLVADEGFNPYVGVVIAKRSTWLEKKDLVKKFVAASREGWQTYLDDPAPANAIMSKLNTAMDAQTFTDAAAAQKPLIVTDETRAKGLGTMSKERWETLAKQLVDLAVLDKAPSVDEILAQDL